MGNSYGSQPKKVHVPVVIKQKKKKSELQYKQDALFNRMHFITSSLPLCKSTPTSTLLTQILPWLHCDVTSHFRNH